MPLYELLVIASHHAQLAPIRTLATTTSSLILANGGVVRSLDHWGTRNLPQRMKRGDGSSFSGVCVRRALGYWTMRFDANPPTVAALNERLRLDPRVLRWTTLKVGTTLAQVISPPEDPTIRYSRGAFVDLASADSHSEQGQLAPGAPRY
ncbi:hypothetical protein RQP46_006953 [Phenoliferia psychrophenolica]